jgi:hypothetical protein
MVRNEKRGVLHLNVIYLHLRVFEKNILFYGDKWVYSEKNLPLSVPRCGKVSNPCFKA